MFKVHEISPFKSVCAWVHDSHNVPRQQHFDEVVANIYSRQQNQCIGAHTDQSELLGKTSDILSLSMGAAGVFFWQPSPDGPLRRWNKKEADRHATERGDGLWGCVPLLPGDLFLAAGTFQHHLHHGSLSYTEAADIEQVLSKYQACNEAKAVLRSPEYLQYFVNSVPLPDRSVITFRRIENHYQGCPQAFQDVYNAPPPPPAPWAGDAAPLATPAPSNTGTDYSIVTDTVERDEPQREGGAHKG